MLLRKIKSLLRVIREHYFHTETDKALSDYYGRLADREKSRKAPPLIVVQCVDNYFYYGLFAEIVASIRKTSPVRVEQYVQRIFRSGSSTALWMYFRNSIFSNLLTDWKWVRLYNTYCNGVALWAAMPQSPWKSIRNFLAAASLWKNLRSTEQLAQLSVRGIVVGDLVIDTYLRYKPSPSVNIHDPYLLAVLFQALRLADRSFSYFGNKRPDIYLTSYSTYIQHGIPVRVALALGTRVLSFGNFQEFHKEITPLDLVHTKNADTYREDFSALTTREEKLRRASEKLAERTTGVIDTATAYMRTSAYAEQNEKAPDVRGALVMFLHDFYDSAHVYKWILFHDFMEWSRFTLDHLIAQDRTFFVKPHPNQIGDSGQAFSRLKADYPGVNFLSPKISNRELAEAGMACAVTIYGSVASEMAFMGVPSISCGDSPHVSFGFGHTARSLDEYRRLLSSYDELEAAPSELQQEACAFYYMHNLNLSVPEKELRDKLVQMRTKIWYATAPEAETVTGGFSELASMPAFVTFTDRLRTMLAEKN